MIYGFDSIRIRGMNNKYFTISIFLSFHYKYNGISVIDSSAQYPILENRKITYFRVNFVLITHFSKLYLLFFAHFSLIILSNFTHFSKFF